jgi:hypothetical protein
MSINECKYRANTNVYKYRAKQLINKKFIVGNHYKLIYKSVCGSIPIIKEFVCKKFIYKNNNKILNIVIMKQISGNKDIIFTADKYICKQFHIKYEPGLQIFSMELPWVKA